MRRITKWFASLTVENVVMLATIIVTITVVVQKIQASIDVINAKADARDVRIVGVEQKQEAIAVKLDRIGADVAETRGDVKVLRAMIEKRVADAGVAGAGS